MAVLKSEIIDKVKLNLNSAGVGTYYSDDDFNDSFLDIYDDIVCQTLPFEKSVDITLEEYKVYYNLYSLVSDYILPVSLYHVEQNKWIPQRNERYLQNLNTQWEQAKGNPCYYTVIDYRFIALYPHPTVDGGTLTLYYKYRPPEPVTEQFVTLSSHNDLMFADGMTADLLAQSGEYQKASIYFNDYIKAIEKESTLIEARTSPDRVFRLAMQELRNNGR